MASAAIYLRVSTDQQSESGLGLEAQESTCREATRRLGLDVAGVFVDAGVSGATGLQDRPALIDAVASLKRGGVLIVAKRDRIGRDVIEVAMIERQVARKGARIVSAAGEGSGGDDPMDVLTRRISDVFAEHERLVIGSRTRAALKAKRARGEKCGGKHAPFGFDADADGRLVVNTEERAIVAEIQALRAEGRSLRAIADVLNGRGIRTKSGAAWKASQVARVVARAA